MRVFYYQGWHALFVFRTFSFLILCITSGFGEVLDFSASPKGEDNFLEASFRFVNPDPETVPEVILVYIPGTDGDGRVIVNDATFLTACKVCHAALLGCYFRGEGLNYDLPSGGSGDALDRAIKRFASATKCPTMVKAPLLLFGHSQGAQFVYNYLCWHPERIKAFAILRPGYFLLDPQENSFRIPGLIAAGEKDESGRIRTAADAFSKASGKHSFWSFLLERNAGHEPAQSSSFALRYFEAICRNDQEFKSIETTVENDEILTLSGTTSDLGWFPNQSLANDWKLLHKPAVFRDLENLSDSPELDKVINFSLTPIQFEAENGSGQSGTLTLNIIRNGVNVDGINISGSGFELENPKDKRLFGQIQVRFAPRNLDWGQVGASIVITGEVDGRRANSLEIGLSGLVEGPLEPHPPVAYFGVTQPGKTTSKSVLLRARTGKAHIVEIKVPSGITATMVPDAESPKDSQLKLTWLAGDRYGRMSGEIRITIDSPQKGTLRIPIVGVVARTADDATITNGK